MLSTNLHQKKALTLPSLTSQPHQVLASDLVPHSDVQQVCTPGQDISFSKQVKLFFLMAHSSIIPPLSLHLQVSKIAAYAYSAISQIKVDAKEELVVQFAIP